MLACLMPQAVIRAQMYVYAYHNLKVKCKAYRQHYMYRYLQTNVRENDGSNDEPPDEAKWRKLVGMTV